MSEKSAGRKGWVDPLTRPVVAATIPASGVDITVTPADAERAALARALDLAAVDAISGAFRLSRRAGGEVRLRGRLTGTVRPRCVVTLEAFPLAVDEDVEMTFVDPPRVDRKTGETDEIDLSGGEDPPDIIENGVIDLGHVVTEFLSLAIPPFPRKPGVAMEEAAEPETESPFAALGRLNPPKT